MRRGNNRNAATVPGSGERGDVHADSRLSGNSGSTYAVSAGSFELARRDVRLLRSDRRRLLHRFPRVRHLGRGVQVKVALRLVISLRLTPTNTLARTVDEVRPLRRRPVERLRRAERNRLRLAALLLPRLLRTVILAAGRPAFHACRARLPLRLLSDFAAWHGMLDVALEEISHLISPP